MVSILSNSENRSLYYPRLAPRVAPRNVSNQPEAPPLVPKKTSTPSNAGILPPNSLQPAANQASKYDLLQGGKSGSKQGGPFGEPPGGQPGMYVAGQLEKMGPQVSAQSARNSQVQLNGQQADLKKKFYVKAICNYSPTQQDFLALKQGEALEVISRFFLLFPFAFHCFIILVKIIPNTD